MTPMRWAAAGAVETLAVAYALLGRAAYAQHAARLLRTWFLDDETRMDPHLNFGQGVPGRSTGRRYGIIETRTLPQLIEAIGLIASSSAWTEIDHQNMKRWFRAYLEWLATSDLGQKEARMTNNHGVWYDVQVAALALFVGGAAGGAGGVAPSAAAGAQPGGPGWSPARRAGPHAVVQLRSDEHPGFLSARLLGRARRCRSMER